MPEQNGRETQEVLALANDENEWLGDGGEIHYMSLLYITGT